MIINYGKYNKDSLIEFEIKYNGFKMKNNVDHKRLEKIILNNKQSFFEKLGFNYTFVINLDRSKDRLQTIKEKLSNIGVSNFIKLRAFDGKNEINEMKENLSEFTILNHTELIEKQKFIKDISYTSVGIGEQGCVASHIFLYKYIIENNIDKAIIMEDDVCFHSNFENLFTQSIKTMPKDGVLYNYLSSYLDIKDSCKDFKIPTWEKYALESTCFYIITKEGAKKLLEAYTLFKEILPVSDDPPFNTLKNSYKLHYNNNDDKNFKNCGNRSCGIVSSLPAGDTNSAISYVNIEKKKSDNLNKKYYKNTRKYDVFGNILSTELNNEIGNLLEEVITIFQKNNIKPILLFGTLLGYARTGKNMLQWDDDIDLGVQKEDEELFYYVVNQSKNIKCIKYDSNGFPPNMYIHKICFKNKDNFNGRDYSYPFIDIFSYITVEKDDPILLRDKVFDEDSPVVFLKPLKIIKAEFFNIKDGIYVPENYEFYLDKWFSNDWKNTCISNNWNHIEEKKINNYQKINCQNLIPFFENIISNYLFENTIIIDYNYGGTSLLESQLKYYNIFPKIITGDKNNKIKTHIKIIENFYKDLKNKNKYITILEENVNLTGFFPNILPKKWEIISLNNCYDNNHCCSSINIENKNFIDLKNNIIKYKKIPENLYISYIINFDGFVKNKKYGLENLNLYDIYGFNPNVTKECFMTVDKYENLNIKNNKDKENNNKIVSSIVIILIILIILILIVLIFLKKNNLKFKKII